MPDNDICRRTKSEKNRQILQSISMKILRKIVGKIKIEQEANKSENHVVSNQLMTELKGEEENGSNM
jgi:hypothetical protein